MSQSDVLNDDTIIKVDAARCSLYPFTPIHPTGSIRLLTVHRAIIEHETGFRQRLCTLTTHTLSARPVYDALSYTWDSPVTNETYKDMYKQRRAWIIEENGTFYRLQLGCNLIEALVYLSETGVPITTIWIDAICVNQDDLQERATQVKQMGFIYASCRQTIVWPGSPGVYECNIGEVHRLHLLVVAAFGAVYGTTSGKRLVEDRMSWTIPNFYERLGLQSVKTKLDWKGYCQFLQHCRWFTRAW